MIEQRKVPWSMGWAGISIFIVINSRAVAPAAPDPSWGLKGIDENFWFLKSSLWRYICLKECDGDDWGVVEPYW
jgi:hypothetical protein